jgi:hypothetical protein
MILLIASVPLLLSVQVKSQTRCLRALTSLLIEGIELFQLQIEKVLAILTVIAIKLNKLCLKKI